MAPGELVEHPEPVTPALDELTEQPGPRMAWSWPPPPWAGGRMGGCETHSAGPAHAPGEPPLANPLPPNHNPAGSSSPPIISRRLPASSSFVLARALTRATAPG